MKKLGFQLFSALFLALCAAPVLGMLLLGPSQAAANEVLASRPVLLDGGGWNWNYLGELADYVNERFAFRQELITAGAELTAEVLGESASDSVVLGKDGWLFYKDTLADYEGASAMTERELWRAARTLALEQEYAASLGARFLFTAAPNKNTLYPEYMPERYPVSGVQSNWERLMPLLEAQGVAYCDLRPALLSAPSPVYYRTDSHWDGLGSALACDAIVSALGGESRLAAEEFTTEPHQGDLYEMLYPAGVETEPGRVLARARTFAYEGNFRGPADLRIRTSGDGPMGSLLMFRDSFGNALHADLAEQFSAAVFSRSTALQLEELREGETVIYELVERNLPWLLTNAPVMPGPRRELETPSETVRGTAAVDRDENAEPLCRYTGSVDCAEMDVDSPVYVALDGVVYEASPAGRGEEAFTLYAPAAERAEVILRCGGTLKRCGQG